MNRRSLTIAAGMVAVLTSASQAFAVGPGNLTAGRQNFAANKYPPAYSLLSPYRMKYGGSLDVDFMLGASACRIAVPGLPAWGSDALKTLGTRYALDASWKQKISQRLSTCGVTLQPVVLNSGAGTNSTFREAFELDRAALQRLEAANVFSVEDARAKALMTNSVILERDVGGTLKNGAIQNAPAAKLGAAGQIQKQ
jgi:hypothetical protein